MPRILSCDQTERRQDECKNTESDNPQRRGIGYSGKADFSDANPGQKGTYGESHAGNLRHDVGPHAGPEHSSNRHYCASLNSSYHAIWIASSFGSFDALGSSSKPERAITRSRRSVNRIVNGSTPGNFSTRARPMSSESLHFIG